MGKDYHTSTCPFFDMTPERENQLLAAVDAVSDEAWEQLSKREGIWSGPQWPLKLRKYIRSYADVTDRSDVGRTPDKRYMFSGGSTFGDPPTLACRIFDSFDAFEPVKNLMCEYMHEDRSKRTLCINLEADCAILHLANGKRLRSGWIDKDDPDALIAGDYLAVDASNGDQLFYVDSADLLADPIAGRKMLSEMIQACM